MVSFSARGSLGTGHQRVFAVINKDRASDILPKIFLIAVKITKILGKVKSLLLIIKLRELIINGITTASKMCYKLNFYETKHKNMPESNCISFWPQLRWNISHKNQDVSRTRPLMCIHGAMKN